MWKTTMCLGLVTCLRIPTPRNMGSVMTRGVSDLVILWIVRRNLGLPGPWRASRVTKLLMHRRVRLPTANSRPEGHHLSIVAKTTHSWEPRKPPKNPSKHPIHVTPSPRFLRVHRLWEGMDWGRKLATKNDRLAANSLPEKKRNPPCSSCTPLCPMVEPEVDTDAPAAPE